MWYLKVEEEKADTRPAVRVEEQPFVISMQGSNKGDAARMLCFWLEQLAEKKVNKFVAGKVNWKRSACILET